MAFRENLTGQRFGRWVVIEIAANAGKRTRWKCKCDCGGEKLVSTEKLKNGESKSCGCYAKQRTSEARKIHGMSKSRFYGIWNDMIMRCYNPKRERYNAYGGRGIRVCKRWRTFNNFYIDMFPSYKDGLTIERDNVNKGYNKNNCRWIPKEDQRLNKVNTIRLTIDGRTNTVPEWAALSGKSAFTIYNRVKLGWNHKDCVYGGRSRN